MPYSRWIFSLLWAVCLLNKAIKLSQAASDSVERLKPKRLRAHHAEQIFRLAAGQPAPSHEVIYPQIVHPESGDFLTHDVSSRLRRSASAEGTAHDDLPILALKFSGLGQDFHVKVSPNERLVPATFRVVSHDYNGGNTTTLMNSEFACHHHGVVVSHGNSPAAISTCDGVSGALYDSNGSSFVLHPIPEEMFNSDLAHYKHESFRDAQPHVIYRREAVLPRRSGCQVNAEHQLEKLPLDVEGGYGLVKQMLDRVRQQEETAGTEDGGRRKRQAPNGNYHLEVMLVGDNALYTRRKFRNDRQAANYLLKIANLAALHFNTDILGVDLSFVISKIVLFNRTDTGLQLGHHSEKTLSSFCAWQHRTLYTPYESDVNHYDLAILVTGWQLCAYSDVRGCDELGRAYVAGACSTYRMCSVVYDNGLTAGFVMAHETGHSLSMRHDGENGCRNGGYLMSPTISGGSRISFWSQCSKNRAIRFVRSRQAYCLRDEPVSTLTTVGALPGRRHSLDEQCKLWLGPRSRFCPYAYARADVCRKLWCLHVNSNCRTANVPAAAGTPCARGSVCYRGTCTQDRFVLPTTQPAPTTPTPVVGEWTGWSTKGNCTRECDGGVQVFTRHCVERGTRRKMEIGTCTGEWLKRDFCNMQQCPEVNTFLKEQCIAAGNARGLHNTSWFPGYLAAASCRLVCRSTRNASIDQPAADGTACSYTDNDRCVNGKCMSVGCDFKQHSRRQYDQCGVCGGDGSTCQKVERLFETLPSTATNFTVVRIPKGAHSLYIKEHFAQQTSHLVLTTINDIPILDGAWMRGRPHTILRVYIAGTRFFYRQVRGKPESLASAVAPINEDLLLKMVRADRQPQRIRYRYYLKPGKVRGDRYMWETSTTSCSVTCGKGSYQQYPVCTEKATMRTVDSLFCVPDTRVFNRTMSCSRSPCRITSSPPPITTTPSQRQADWKVTGWSVCSATCGSGSKMRRVVCRLNSRTVPVSNCDPSNIPPARRACSIAECPTTRPSPVNGGWSQWSEWSLCSATCDGGIQHQFRTCTNPAPTLGGRNCTGETTSTRLCEVNLCPNPGADIRVGMCANKDNTTDKWLPHSAGLQVCTLVCRQARVDVAVSTGVQLHDGSKCSDGQNDRCIDGKCTRVGCDNAIGGSAKFDYCGVCRGTGSTCRNVSDRYNIAHALPGLRVAATIPRGARLVTVAKLNQKQHNHLVLRAAVGAQILYPLSDMPADIQGNVHLPFSNGYVNVKVTNTKELFTIAGPLQEDVQILLNTTRFSHRPSTPGLLWRYTVDRESTRQGPVNLADRFERVMLVGGCSVTCGQGVWTLQERCMRKSDSRLASAQYCGALPAVVSRTTTDNCYRAVCPSTEYEWAPQQWGACSASCGRGTQRRLLKCRMVGNNDTFVSNNMCLSRARAPAIEQDCSARACPRPAKWMTSNWQQCTATCGGGVQQRRVFCVVHAKGQECPPPRPPLQQQCGIQACPVPQRSVCTDRLSSYYCSLVRSFALCLNRRYADACCATCIGAR